MRDAAGPESEENVSEDEDAGEEERADGEVGGWFGLCAALVLIGRFNVAAAGRGEVCV